MVPVYNWTGFYLGGNIGYAWRNTEITGIFGANLGDLSNDRFILAVKWAIIGRSTNLVSVSGAGDFDWADRHQATPFVHDREPRFGAGPCGSQLGDDAGRLTLAMPPIVGCSTPRWVLVGPRRMSLLQSPGLVLIATNDKSNVGSLIVGFGVEYAFAQNWTAKIKYYYLGLSDTTVPVVANLATFSHDLQTLKIGAKLQEVLIRFD